VKNLEMIEAVLIPAILKSNLMRTTSEFF